MFKSCNAAAVNYYCAYNYSGKKRVNIAWNYGWHLIVSTSRLNTLEMTVSMWITAPSAVLEIGIETFRLHHLKLKLQVKLSSEKKLVNVCEVNCVSMQEIFRGKIPIQRECLLKNLSSQCIFGYC